MKRRDIYLCFFRRNVSSPVEKITDVYHFIKDWNVNRLYSVTCGFGNILFCLPRVARFFLHVGESVPTFVSNLKTKNMKKIVLLIGILLMEIPFLSAEDGKIELRNKGIENKKEQSENPIPVDVDFYQSELGIHFSASTRVYVLVSGPEGVVYSHQLTSQNAMSVFIDLSAYADGDYTIVFYDVEGNKIVGNFVKGNK